MAKKEYVKIIQQGTDIWNEWRWKHQQVAIPDLSDANLSDTDLRRANLSDTDLRRANLRRANFSGANFSGANLILADLSGAKLGGTDLILADLNNADLNNADLRRANLSGAKLSDADLNNADLRRAKLSDADLRRAKLSDAKLSDADLSGANLSGTDLSGANLSGTDLSGANLSGTDLSGADLSNANLRDANLRDADFRRANLRDADLRRANLRHASLSNTTVGWTVFGDIDLRQVKGLEEVKHKGPSTIGIDTLVRSEGAIPETFLKGAGVPNNVIAYARSLVAIPIEYYTCFISYSSQDHTFAERLYADLQHKGVRCWYAPEDMKTGDVIRDRIDQSIRLYDKLLLVLSEHSAQSKWVRFEVEAALDKECEGKPPVLFPVRLDDAVIKSSTSWAAHIQRSRHITDFSKWKQHDDYQKAFTRLLRDLQPDKISKDE